MTVAAGVALPDHYQMLASIIVPGMLFFEAVGPPLVARSLRIAGEIHTGESSA